MNNDNKYSQSHPPDETESTRPIQSTSARLEIEDLSAQNHTQETGALFEGGRLDFLRQPRAQVILILALAVLLITSAGGALGWSSGRSALGATATFDAGFYMFEQYNLALADMEAGNFELARQRLEFIFLADPSFLDVADKWIEVALVLGQTAAPTELALSTPSPTPTQDPRPKEDLLLAAQALVAAHDWTTAIDTLLALRKADPNFLTADVDGMLYLSLRNRGVQNILEFGLFEPGLYDFSLAENFGPLDGQALNYQEWARFYLYGNAFWVAYPQEAAYYYGQLVGLAPDLRDSSGLSAFYRYWQSLIHYADQLALAEDWCPASQQYQLAQDARNDAGLQPTADFVLEQCVALTPSATFTPTGTSIVTFAPTRTASLTATPDLTGSVSPTTGESATFTSTPSETVPSADTETPSETPIFSETPVETATFTETPSETPSETPEP